MNRPKLVVNIEMDDRTVLFPDGKFLTHVSVQEVAGERIRLEAVYMFNAARAETLIAELEAPDALELSRACLETVYQGRTQHVLSDTAKIAVVFNPNGFVLRFGEGELLRELFICSPAIIRLAQGMLRALDAVGAAVAN